MKKLFFYKNKRGAIVLEYVLLLVACVAVAELIRTTIVDMNPDPASRGFMINAWENILQVIAEDTE